MMEVKMLIQRNNVIIQVDEKDILSDVSPLTVGDILTCDTFEQMISVIQQLNYSKIKYRQREPMVLSIV